MNEYHIAEAYSTKMDMGEWDNHDNDFFDTDFSCLHQRPPKFNVSFMHENELLKAARRAEGLEE